MHGLFFTTYYLTFTSNCYLRKLKNRGIWIKNQTSLFFTRYGTILFLIPVVFCVTIYENSPAFAQDSQPKITITVRYANDTLPTYTILADNHQTYTISQKNSWSKDDFRYNVQAYSIDKGPNIPINRMSGGNFTLDVMTDSDHSILFFAKPQFQITLHDTSNATFVPPSPTNDNWFDMGTDVQFLVPYVVPSDKQDTRQQLDGWSLDNSYINAISRQESGSFKSDIIHMSSDHTVNLEYKTQYYIKVISNFGRTLGTGWYNSGSIVDISVIPGNDIISNHVFAGWQGSTIGNQNQESVETLADSPKVMVANWSVDYTNVSIIGIVIIAVLVLLAIYQKRRTPSRI
ncbi:exported protein of unknown function [Nitrosotalea devaniterrae]|uniref:Bacterial repeat domain-containing protein n=1 Tax=Nitrosotalea devaniterrae TaxID=1078905 RepID=A0A128A457_9ARCH|nr:exported protein of unknown function [Candidatus Nitrosotalea devanaterra]